MGVLSLAGVSDEPESPDDAVELVELEVELELELELGPLLLSVVEAELLLRLSVLYHPDPLKITPTG